jgi:outer membrane protein OmpA-like peptidoglycan-associated protein
MSILLNSSEFKKNIQGVYIEGFTDDIGDDIANLNLSQNRSLSIGRYIVEYYKNQKSPDEYETLLKWLYLNGRGEQNKKCLPKTNNSCDEESQSASIDRDASRRVEITIRVKSSEQRKAIESKVKRA